MKSFKKLLQEQSPEVKQLRDMAAEIVNEKIAHEQMILGTLLTGSVARGDARIGPLGVMIDLTIVTKTVNDVSLEEIFGADEEPFIPSHCVTLHDNIGLAVQTIEENELWKIRTKDEPSIFAMNESVVLNDKKGILKKWKEEYFEITPDQVKERALNHYFRYCYLTNDYRFEKWSYRKAWEQIAQNFNEANECYCNFLYCINDMFIPRKDWLAYLTYEMKIRPENHRQYMAEIYEMQLNDKLIKQKCKTYQAIERWMSSYIKGRSWL
ncbi:MAG TPA: DUF4037 domain-containing protein [Spirochaetota bacterium]|nr:DUF4037 domain-containing protein [Spirochaetota bacterium]